MKDRGRGECAEDNVTIIHSIKRLHASCQVQTNSFIHQKTACFMSSTNELFHSSKDCMLYEVESNCTIAYSNSTITQQQAGVSWTLRRPTDIVRLVNESCMAE